MYNNTLYRTPVLGRKRRRLPGHGVLGLEDRGLFSVGAELLALLSRDGEWSQLR
jgi:hypothetical protein